MAVAIEWQTGVCINSTETGKNSGQSRNPGKKMASPQGFEPWLPG